MTAVRGFRRSHSTIAPAVFFANWHPMTIALNPSNDSPFALFGGEPGVRTLVDAFYDHMDLDEPYAGIRKLHPESLDGSRDKLYWFLCGWLGGPIIIKNASVTRAYARGTCPSRLARPSATLG